MRVLEERLVLEAKRNLTYTNMTVAQIAYYLGFMDPAYFSRFFSKLAGESPAAFRKPAAASSRRWLAPRGLRHPGARIYEVGAPQPLRPLACKIAGICASQ